MRKVIIGAVCATTTTMPVALLSNSKQFKEPTWTSKLIPRLVSASDIKNKSDDVKCLDVMSDEIDWTGIDTVKSNTFSSSSISDFNSSGIEGCLAIEYVKQTFTSGKWWGEFKLVWLLKSDNQKQGIVTVVNVKTEDGKLTGDSAAYIFTKKEGDDNKWEVKYAKENEKQDITTTQTSNLIPKPGNLIKDHKDSKDKYWNFDPDPSKVCNLQECNGTEGKLVTVSDIWNVNLVKGQDTDKVQDWCDNFDNWLNNNFKWNDFSTKLQSLKKATWDKKVETT